MFRKEELERIYVKLADKSLLFQHYVYLDMADHLADDIFISEKMRVYGFKDFAKEGTVYRMVFCKVPKWNRLKFERCMNRLESKMQLFGYRSWPQVWKLVFGWEANE